MYQHAAPSSGKWMNKYEILQSWQLHFPAENMRRHEPHALFFIIRRILVHLIKLGNAGAFLEIIKRRVDAAVAGFALHRKQRFPLLQYHEVHFAFVRVP